MNFAEIYNPKTKETHGFIESDISDFDLKVCNFHDNEFYYFKTSDTNPFLDVLSLKEIHAESNIKEDYTDFVKKIVSNIREAKFSKVVAAQKQVFDFDTAEINYQNLFDSLIENFSSTYIFLIYVKEELWIGASPETVGVLEGDEFSTISLAGTRRGRDFNDKEIKEQEIVSKAISNQLCSFSSKMDSTSTQFMAYGNLNHLVNEHKMQVDEGFDFNKAIHEIHPSPAIAGYPKIDSIDFIREYEPLERELYAGLVQVGLSNNMQYSFAMIRCARITKNMVSYYAGAGITEDSDPDSEWEETLDKIEVLKNVFDSTLS